MNRSRRNFLRSSALLASGAMLPQPARAMDPVARARPSHIKLSCAAYSFRQYLTGKASPSMTLDDFIDRCVGWGLSATELTSYYFPQDVTPEYLRHLKHKTYLLGLRISGTAIGNKFTLPPGPKRDAEIAHVKKWIDHAAEMDAPSIRIFAGKAQDGSTLKQAQQWCIECIETACQYAARRGVFLALENHGGITATPDMMLPVVEGVKSEWFGVNLDTGNFRTDDPYRDIARLAPYAITVQLKASISVKGQGIRPADFKRIIEILDGVDYRGYLALEYEDAEPAHTAVPRHIATLQKLLG